MVDQVGSVRELHDAFAGPLFVFALRSLGDRQAAEEIVQDTLVRAWQAADRFDPTRGSLSTWLFTIARNLTTDQLRRAAVRPHVVASVDAVEPPSTDGEVDRALDAWQMASALAELSDDHRTVVVEAYYGGRTVSEIAERLGAYVLGGLPADERHAVEQHLSSCPECRDELSRLSSLPPLLGRLSAEEARGGTLVPPTTLADRVAGEVGAEAADLRRQVRRLRLVAAAAAALSLVAAAVAVVVSQPGGGPALDPPLVAEVVPVAADAAGTEGTAAAYAWEWGTTVELEVSDLPARDAYVLWTVGEDGSREQAGTWGPTADHGARLRSASSIQRHDLTRVEVQDPAGTVLFAFDF